VTPVHGHEQDKDYSVINTPNSIENLLNSFLFSLHAYSMAFV